MIGQWEILMTSFYRRINRGTGWGSHHGESTLKLRTEFKLAFHSIHDIIVLSLELHRLWTAFLINQGSVQKAPCTGPSSQQRWVISLLDHNQAGAAKRLCSLVGVSWCSTKQQSEIPYSLFFYGCQEKLQNSLNERGKDSSIALLLCQFGGPGRSN